MKIGMNLPVMVPGLDRELILEWSRRVDAGPYASLAAGERITFPNPEVMVTLAAPRFSPAHSSRARSVARRAGPMGSAASASVPPPTRSDASSSWREPPGSGKRAAPLLVW